MSKKNTFVVIGKKTPYTTNKKSDILKEVSSIKEGQKYLKDNDDIFTKYQQVSVMKKENFETRVY